MSGILLDANGDMAIEGGKLVLTSGVEATRQRLEQRLKLFFGEWFLDKSRGVPYFEQVFTKQPNPTLIDAVFKREILLDPAMRELQEFSLDLDPETRVLTVRFRARTDDGPIDFTTVVAA